MCAQETFRLPNTLTCITACSGSGARCWRSDSRGSEWTVIKQFRHEAGTRREAEFVSDKPGRSFDSFGAGRHSMSKEHSGREQDEMQFADQVAEYLDRGVRMGDFHKIVLFAEHKFLGLLRERLSSAAKQAVVFEAPKNLTKLDESDIKRYFT
ncbi:hypothetical protein GWP57_14445 [Gammaproteobacteria bacterium]|nr:hypothetical protein [Gammaproteobacteria bacterium]